MNGLLAIVFSFFSVANLETLSLISVFGDFLNPLGDFNSKTIPATNLVTYSAQVSAGLELDRTLQFTSKPLFKSLESVFSQHTV